MQQTKGTLVEDGAFATLTFVRTYPHAPEHVWDAIATPEGLGAWLMCTHALIEGRVGGRIEFVSGPAGYRSTGKILAWEPPRVLEYEWNVAPMPEMPCGENAIFRYELAPAGHSTRLVVTYRRITRRRRQDSCPVCTRSWIGLKLNLTVARCPTGRPGSAKSWLNIRSGARMRPLQENDVFHAIAHPARREILSYAQGR